jgi:hypothetical protein
MVTINISLRIRYMATQESTPSAESAVDAAESKARATLSTYIDNLIAGQEKLTESFEAAGKRSLRVSEEIMAAIIAGQRDVVDLSKSLAAEPRAYAKNMNAAMDMFIGMQQRSLAVAKILYREQSDAADIAKTAWEPMLASTAELRSKFRELSAAWMKPLSA